MKKRKWKRIHKTKQFTVAQAAGEPSTFCVRWLKRKYPESYLQRIFQAANPEYAIRRASIVAGFEPDVEYIGQVPLDVAFSKTLASSRRNKEGRGASDFNKAAMDFVKFLVQNYPNISNWNQLSRQHIREYDESFGEVADNTRRLRLQPLVQTDNYMANEYGFKRIAEGLGLSNRTVRAACRVHLIDVLEFLDYLRDNYPMLEAGVALQGLAGMRLEEVYRLTWNKIDFARGLVEISGVVKNCWSERLIPVCKRVLEVLVRARGKIRSLGDENDTVVSGYTTPDNYSRGIVTQIENWNSKVDWRPGDLRNLLPTWATSNSCMDALWEQYIGHAPGNITARHYVPRLACASTGEGEETESAMELFRTAVTRKIDAAIVKAQEKLVQKNRVENAGLSATEL